jgi:predicted ATPase
MILQSLKFEDIDSNNHAWSLNRCNFEHVNLVVARNSTGKTRLLNLIMNFGRLVCGEISPFPLGTVTYEVEFINCDNAKVEYFVKIKQGLLIKEELSIDNKVVLSREENGTGNISAYELDRPIRFQVPNNKLACVAKRDSIQHPYLDELFNWGSSLRHYMFGSDFGRNYAMFYSVPSGIVPNQELNAKDQNPIVLLLKKLIEASDESKERVLQDLRGIGYSISDIGVMQSTLLGDTGIYPVMGIYIEESEHLHRVEQHEISQGLFRALSLFIQLRYSEYFGQPSLILVDDIGEGLDYERSKLLIKALVALAEKSGAQLIMSTNDRFVMNNVPLKYWFILTREGGQVSSLNYKNSKAIFDDFELTGLSNFDFFSSKYYERELSTHA